MKDRLEEYVRSHQHEFDVFEPDAALWGGIEKKMKKKKKVSLHFYLSRAASVAAIFILSFIIQKQFFNNQSNGFSQIPELQEAEMYYSGVINSKLEEVKPMLTDYPEIKTDLEYDLTELDSVYNSLKEDLKDNVANQEVIEAMIENYRLRINILEEMQLFLSDKTDNNDINNNTTGYEL